MIKLSDKNQYFVNRSLIASGLLGNIGVDAFLVSNLSNIYYLTGFSGSAAKLLIKEDKLILLVDSRYIEQVSIESPHVKVEQISNLHQSISDLVRSFNIKRLGFESAYMPYKEYLLLEKLLRPIILINEENFIENMRLIKDQLEIEIIKSNISIISRNWEAIKRSVQSGKTEKSIANDILFRLLNDGAKNAAFDFIVASGIRGSLPHGISSDKIVNKNEMVTLDWGINANGYNVDMTRNFFTGNSDENQLLEIHEIVLKANIETINGIKPGITAYDVDKIGRDIITQHGYSGNFGHGIGHGVGIDIHERPSISSKGREILKKGMIFTVEPGIYLPGVGGVRIEDMVLVTDDSVEVLTSSIPKECVIVS